MGRYQNEPEFRHDGPRRLGILITNLGTPDAAESGAVRRYLAEFLSDPRVVEIPRVLWWVILHGIILRVRPRRSAAAYRKVWGEDGSPLLTIAESQRAGLEEALARRVPGDHVVALAMRYGNPSIPAVLETLRVQGVRRLLVLPMYPQYSATTTASTFDAIARVFMRRRWIPELRTINHYHDEPGYIDALAESVRAHWEQNGRGERLLFSFHGIPKRYLLNGDPYHCQCQKTARLVAGALGLDADDWTVSFQSRLGREEWLRPYTDHVLEEWGRGGGGDIDVICPGFSADCLETLEEVDIQYRELYRAAGGGVLRYIPALNDTRSHLSFVTELICRHLKGWPEADAPTDHERDRARLERALALGAER